MEYTMYEVLVVMESPVLFFCVVTPRELESTYQQYEEMYLRHFQI